MNSTAVPNLEQKVSHFSDDLILNSLECAVLVINKGGLLVYSNNAAENLFESSSTQLVGLGLEELFPKGSPVATLVKYAQENLENISEFGVSMETHKISRQLVNIQITNIREIPGSIVVNIFSRLI